MSTGGQQWNAPTGVFGLMFIQTPKVNGVELGLTDLHYNSYDDDVNIDSVQYGILSSAPSLYASPSGRSFPSGRQCAEHPF